MREAEFYDQPQLWGAAPEPYQVQARADVLDILPPDVESVLDVGCGDGFITNALPQTLHIVGADISREALAHVQRETVAASITKLPFEDNAFDLVMTNDVLEHLPDAEHAQALAELARVARKYVLVTVPHAEQLAASFTKCAACQTVYHVNRHHRRYSCIEMMRLLDAPFRPVEVRLSGDVTLQPADRTVGLRHELGLYHTWASAVCPECGSKVQVAPPANSSLGLVLDVYRSMRHAQDAGPSAAGNARTEIMGLYAMEGVTYDPPARTLPMQAASLLDVDFANPLQRCTNDFTAGSYWARFTVPADVEQSANGLRRVTLGDAAAIVPVRLPVRVAAGDTLHIAAQGAGAGARLDVYGLDGVLGTQLPLAQIELDTAQREVELTLEQAWWPDRFGTALEFYLTGPVCLERMSYRPANRAAPVAPFVQLAPGNNTLRKTLNGTCHAWGYYTANGGSRPAPDLEDLTCPEHTDDDPATVARDVLTILDAGYSALRQDVQKLNALCEQREQLREVAETAFVGVRARKSVLEARVNKLLGGYAQTRNQLRELQTAYDRATDELEQHRLHQIDDAETIRQLAADSAYARHEWEKRTGLRGAALEIARSVKRKLIGLPLPVPAPEYKAPWEPVPQPPAGAPDKTKVLVLSHMFPHPDQPSSGPFIHEQVRALAERDDMDVRVLVGRPFWMRHRSPALMWRANRCYKQYLDVCGWLRYDGVLVKYVPYRIFGPFMTHGWAYRSAILHRIEELQQAFPFDVVHAHTSYTDGSAGRALSRRYDVPLIITEHTGPFSILMRNPVVKRTTLRSIRSAARVLSVSHAQENNIRKFCPDQPGSRFTVVPNVVDLELFQPPAKWQPDPAAPRILFVGYFVPIKRLPLLLAAFAQVQQKVPGATLQLVGGGETPEQNRAVLEEITRLGLGNAVQMLGYQPRARIAELLQDACDLLVLSSAAETFGCVLVEAMACGKPAVSTRSGGPEDIITNSDVGELAAEDTPAGLAAALLRVIKRLPDYSPQRLRAHAEQHFGSAAVAAQIAGIYQEARARV
jgi:glycosyltransferase involved in cell wall biosynthesis/SAM-dependent methyltransferase